MSRTVIKRGVPSDRHDELVDELKTELEQGQNVQPAILEEEYPKTNSRHVYVIWDRWSSVADEDRTDVILRAYAKLEGNELAENIALAVGLTSSEAVGFGLLPFVVQPAHANADTTALITYEQAKRREAENTVLRSASHGLRYPSIEAAEKAVERLQLALPGSKWTISQEVRR